MEEEEITFIAVGCVILTVGVEVHPNPSVTVIVYVPAESPVAAELAPPDGDH